MMRRLRRRPASFWAGGVLLGALAVTAVCARVIAPIDPQRTGGVPLERPSPHHWFGTDELGRDVWSNIAYGARTALLVGGLAAALSAAAGTAAGLAAGFGSGLADEAVMRLAEIVQVAPAILMALLLVAFFGARLWTLVSIIAITGWPMIARIVRSEVLSLRERDFVLAARAAGGGSARIMCRHLLPNALPAVVISLPALIGRAVLLEAGLSFLGLGDAGAASWGRLLQSSQEYMREAWWLAVAPGAVLTAAVLALYLMAEGAYEPRRIHMQ